MNINVKTIDDRFLHRLRHTFPTTYAANDVKEKFVLWRAANFRSQVATFLPHIGPLVLSLENELGVLVSNIDYHQSINFEFNIL